MSDPFFLSAFNPIATADQRDLENEALELLATPPIRTAIAQAGGRCKALIGGPIPAEAVARFDAAMEEWAFYQLMLALNGDPNYPRVANSISGPPHNWFGHAVPGSRGPCTAELVDANYAFFPVDGHSHYELRCKRSARPTGDCPIHIVANATLSMNVASLSLKDTAIEPDGSFVVTVSPEPANGRSNHLQTTLDARYVYIRDLRTDWRQIPSTMRVARLDPPHMPPQTREQKISMAARFIVDNIGAQTGFRTLVCKTIKENTVTAPEVSAGFGGQQTQRLGRGYLKLAEDEAYVLKLGSGGAGYHVVTAYDWWFMSTDFWNRTSSLNQAQSIADADGGYTYVMANRDPGIHNWIDLAGCHELPFLIRWQMLPDDPYPWCKGQVVKFAELAEHLPDDVKRVSPVERQQQLAERLATFNTRYVDQ